MRIVDGRGRKEERGKSDDVRVKREKERKRRGGKLRQRGRGNTLVRGESSISHSRAQFSPLSSYAGSSSLLLSDTHSSRPIRLSSFWIDSSIYFNCRSLLKRSQRRTDRSAIKFRLGCLFFCSNDTWARLARFSLRVVGDINI